MSLNARSVRPASDPHCVGMGGRGMTLSLANAEADGRRVASAPAQAAGRNEKTKKRRLNMSRKRHKFRRSFFRMRNFIKRNVNRI
ncbi:MAG: hypothetical protein WA979_10775 [Pacificimonas sp.]